MKFSTLIFITVIYTSLGLIFILNCDFFLFVYLCLLFFGYKEEGKETMEDWDQEMLEKVVQSKSNEYNKNKPTDIVSFQLFASLSFILFLG